MNCLIHYLTKSFFLMSRTFIVQHMLQVLSLTIGFNGIFIFFSLQCLFSIPNFFSPTTTSVITLYSEVEIFCKLFLKSSSLGVKVCKKIGNCFVAILGTGSLRAQILVLQSIIDLTKNYKIVAKAVCDKKKSKLILSKNSKNFFI